MNIIQKDWQWQGELSRRETTPYCVIHHTACPNMFQDTDEIMQEHLNVGDIGIAYNRVIKGDGVTVQGRPDWAISAAAHGANRISIDICVEGNFEASESAETPTPAAVTALCENICDIDQLYPGIKFIGHNEVKNISGDPSDATACPGSTLIAMLPGLIAAALKY